MTGSSILSVTTSAKRWSRPSCYWIVKTLVVEAPHAQVDGCSSHPARLIGGHEDRHVGHLRERRKPSHVGPACDQLVELFPGNAPCLGMKPEDFLDRARLRLPRSEEHTSELQSLSHCVCRLLSEI